jgi:hypothetical protein
MEASFGIDPERGYFQGALLYKLQRKHADRIGNQPNSSTVSIKDATTNIYLLLVWNEGWQWNKYGFYVCLMEYASNFIWNEDKLWTFYEKYGDRFRKDYKASICTWLMNDGTLMKTKFDVTYGSDYKLSIVLSKGTWKHSIEEPIQFDPKRLVLSLLMLNVLMYTVRFRSRPSVKLNIHNQCLNVNLVSPIYFTKHDLECHRPPSYKVCASDIMRSGFIRRIDSELYAILIYRLQIRRPHKSIEISEDMSISAYLLVVWRISLFNELYADTLMVECDKDFVWNKDNLEKLHDKNIYSSRLHPGSATEIWSLNDNVALMTTSGIMSKGRIVNIAISEIEEYHSTRTPIHIDLKR